MMLAARPEVERQPLYQMIERLTNGRPGVQRYADDVMLDIARRPLTRGLVGRHHRPAPAD